LTKGKYACALIVGGFVNLSEVVNFLKISEVDISIICAGKLNAFCLEDALCAGMMTSKLVGKKIRTFDLSDSAFAVVELHKSLGTNLLKSLQDSEHGRYLTEIGFGEDLKVCSQIDSIPVLPLMEDNVVRLRK
jgi:2-phosphosulfolactate phosphatase